MSFTTKIANVCTGCGTCVAVCRPEAIRMVEVNGYFQAKKDKSICNACGLCEKVCPQINALPVIADKAPLKVFKGFCLEEDIRYKATSGGIVTSLLLEMLKQGEIEAVLEIQKKQDQDFIVYEPFWASTKEQILSSSGSAYQPVPVNILLHKIQDYKKVALVGLPCQIQGVRNFLKMRPALGEKVALTIGLTCSHNISRLATKELMRASSINRLDDLAYRGNGWPGGVSLVNGEKRFFFDNLDSAWHDMFSAFIYCTPYCLQCNDHLAEHSDINVSDAWLKEELGKKGNPGASIVAAWTDRGVQVLDQYSGQFEFEDISFKKLQRSQLYPLFFKKHIFSNREGVVSQLVYQIIKMVNLFSFSFLYRFLPKFGKKKFMRLSRKTIYRLLRFTKGGQQYFAQRQ